MRWACLVLLAIAQVATASADNRVIADRVAAIVNDEVILVSELDGRMLPLRAQAAAIQDKGERERRLARLALQMLDEMINDELVVQAGVAAKVTVEPEEVDQALLYIKKQNGFDDSQLQAEMKRQGVTRTTLKNDILRQRAINQLVGPKVTVGDDEVRARYDDMARRAQDVTAVNISQILFGLPEKPTEAQIVEAKQKAQRALERVKAGESFATVGGQLASASVAFTDNVWLDAGTVIPELETIVFAMAKGDLRGPIEAPGGVYVLFANDLKRTQLKSFADMKDQIGSQLKQAALAKHAQAWIEELRKKAYIDIKLH